MEIPGIIIGGQDIEEMKEKIMAATKHYLHSNDSIHDQVQKGKLVSALSTSNMDIMVDIEKFSVKCE